MMRAIQQGDRVALGDMSIMLQGTVIGEHNSTYGPADNKKNFSGFKVLWDNTKIGICSAEDLTLISE